MKLRAAERMEGVERTLIRRIFDSAPPDAIQLGLGQPDLATPDAMALGGVQAIVEGRTAYTSTAGDPELRRAIAAAYAPFAADERNALVTIGSQEALFATCLTLVDPGAEILFPDPGYPAYPVVARLIGARPVPYPLRAERGFRLDPDDLEPLLNERTRLVVLLSPSNPTGACIERDALARTVERLERRGVPWLSDEIYAGFDFEGRFVSPAALAPEGGLVISGLSKDCSMTGWRVGWVVGAAEIVARVTAAHQYLVTCASSVSQRAALAAFSPAGRAARSEMLERFRVRRGAMAEALAAIPDLRFELPDGAFYFFVDVSRYGSSAEVARRTLERRGVVTIPGEAFGRRGAGFLRISFAASLESIREGVQRLGAELAAMAREER